MKKYHFYSYIEIPIIAAIPSHPQQNGTRWSRPITLAFRASARRELKFALDNYFRVARGRSAHDADQQAACCGVAAGEMTKWFDTNYHYIVPEFDAHTQFTLDVSRLVQQLGEARARGVRAKPVIVGPVTYLWLGKAKDDSDRLALLLRILPVYAALLDHFAALGIEWVQIDEPALATELDAAWRDAFVVAYDALSARRVRVLLARSGWKCNWRSGWNRKAR